MMQVIILVQMMMQVTILVQMMMQVMMQVTILVQTMMQTMGDGGVYDTFTQKSFHAILKNHIVHQIQLLKPMTNTSKFEKKLNL
jgi:hypothetical protein